MSSPPSNMTPGRRLRVLVAHFDQRELHQLRVILETIDHDVVLTCQTTSALVADALTERPDLIVTALELEDANVLSALVRIGEVVAIPAVVVAPAAAASILEEAVLDHIMAYLAEPVNAAALIATTHLALLKFEQFEALRREAASLREAYQERKTIERAKARVMRRNNVDENTAYLYLRRMATNNRIKLAEAASRILKQNG